jgi:hypothetical protein
MQAYIAQLQGGSGQPAISGPDHLSYLDSSGLSEIPIGRLRSMVGGCRAANFNGSGTGLWLKIVQQFECLKPGSPDKVVSVSMTFGDGGKAVTSILITLGGDLGWPGPAPSGPAWATFDSALYEKYKIAVERFVNAVHAGSIESATFKRPLRMKLYAPGEIGSDLSIDRVRSILQPCKVTYSVAASVQVKAEDPAREGLKTYMKCDLASSAPADFALYVAFTNGEVDTLLVSAVYNYQIPSSSTVARK